MDMKIEHLNLRNRAGPCRLRPEITRQCMDVLLGDAGTGAPGGDVVATVTRKGGTPVRDLTGQVFGELTVLERAENSKAGKARWLCRCSCSGTKTVLGAQLVNGGTKTCGDRKKHFKPPAEDVVGKRFGELVVLQELEPHVFPNGKKQRRVLCRCSCGYVFEYGLSALRRGKNPVTACKACRQRMRSEQELVQPRPRRVRKFKDVPSLVGQRFGRLTVLEDVPAYTDSEGYHRAKCRCLCDCGKETMPTRKALVRGTTKSCGCLRRDLSSKASWKDLTGQRFNRLVVLRRVEDRVFRSGKHHVMYECCCDCGAVITVSGAELRNGQKSCGCQKREEASKRCLRDLSGQRFGMLLVIRRVSDHVCPDGTHRVMYECRCDCGSTAIVGAAELRNGQKSCGCSRYKFVAEAKVKDLSSQRFGRLVALEMTGEQTNQGNMLWRCRCDCGNENVIVSSSNLLSGNTGSCGCSKRGCSKLETYVKQYFDSGSVGSFDHYDMEVKFEDLRGVSDGKLSYDFGLYSADGNLECLIECQGMQHYEPVDRFGGENQLEVQRVHDALKREYASNHGVRLIEVPYVLRTYDKVAAYLRDAGIA